MKHAFLIIAHNLFDQLQILLNILDDERNDIYVHIDKKISKIPSLVTSKSNLFISQKIDVRWGSRSQIEVELYLFEKAYLSNTNYSYYHLLSGVDLPIKNNDYIHSFFSQHMGYEFVGICHTNDDFFINRINRYHLFTKYYRNNNPIIGFLRFISEKIINKIFKRPLENIKYKFGPNWCSITDEFCGYLIKEKNNILKLYSYTTCADEIYKQTIIYNSPFVKKMFDMEDGYKGCMRLVDWERGNPYIYGAETSDFDVIINSSHLFARKFDIEKYPQIVYKIQEYIK